MTHDDFEAEFGELDEQIRAALQVDTPPDQLARLERFWQHRSLADRRRRIARRVAALAAAVLVTLVTAWWQWHERTPVAPSPELMAHGEAGPPSPNDPVVHQESDGAPRGEGGTSPGSAGRPATEYEQLVLAIRSQQRRAIEQGPAVEAVRRAIDAMLHDPGADIGPLLDSAELPPAHVESLLLSQLRCRDEAVVRAAVQLLATHGSARSTLRLLALCERPTLQADALQAIERLVGFDGLAFAATQSGNWRVRGTAYRHLWKNPDAVDVCLSLVRNKTLRNEVLAVVDDLAPPTREAMFKRLGADDPAVRLAAALTLGRANGPVIAKSLIDLVLRDPSCNAETWIALMSCQGPQTEQFFSFATNQPRLLGSLNRARAYWARIIATGSVSDRRTTS